jgi:hypothetical protein
VGCTTCARRRDDVKNVVSKIDRYLRLLRLLLLRLPKCEVNVVSLINKDSPETGRDRQLLAEVESIDQSCELPGDRR